MVNKHQMLVHEFDPNSLEQTLPKFGLALPDHMGQEVFKMLYEIRNRMGLDVLRLNALAQAALNGKCEIKFSTK
tara:strand:- start:88 stop:309 length:222 start_codon:yes stop_codon:yes gene_type:complete